MLRELQENRDKQYKNKRRSSIKRHNLKERTEILELKNTMTEEFKSNLK